MGAVGSFAFGTYALSIALSLSSAGVPRMQSQKPCSTPVLTSDPKYAPGQVWSFKARDFEPDASITILRVETLPKTGEVIHVRFDGIRLRNCSGGSEPHVLEHAPLTREALERSVEHLLRVGEVPPYTEGYEMWRKACGGVYTITLREILALDEATFNQQFGCSVQ